MSGTIYSGLCSTCKHASTCIFPRDPRRPSIYCEEFEIEITTPGKTATGDTARSKESHIAEAQDSSVSIGLCIDCENVQSCVFQKPDGGIWHCEEYR